MPLFQFVQNMFAAGSPTERKAKLEAALAKVIEQADAAHLEADAEQTERDAENAALVLAGQDIVVPKSVEAAQARCRALDAAADAIRGQLRQVDAEVQAARIAELTAEAERLNAERRRAWTVGIALHIAAAHFAGRCGGRVAAKGMISSRLRDIAGLSDDVVFPNNCAPYDRLHEIEREFSALGQAELGHRTCRSDGDPGLPLVLSQDSDLVREIRTMVAKVLTNSEGISA